MQTALIRSALAALPILCSTAAAQSLHLNELYISHSGVDDQEFVEVVGTPGASLDNVVFLIVESDSGANAGTIDFFADLSGNSIPADGYFVFGTDGVAGVDLVLGSDNLFENSSSTAYLLMANNVSAVAALAMTNVSTGADTTSIGAQGTILDSVSIHDADGGDVAFDGAPIVGPDATFLPAGIYRGSDYPNDWCTQLFHDFDDVANHLQPRTPGAENGACSLFVDVPEISVVTGGTQSFTLDAGAVNANKLYWILGSATGTSPGFPVTGVVLPIAFDFYSNVTLSNANSGPFVNTFSTLDGSGQATASISLTGGTALLLAGTTLYHTFGVIDPVLSTVIMAGNATKVDLVN